MALSQTALCWSQHLAMEKEFRGLGEPRLEPWDVPMMLQACRQERLSARDAAISEYLTYGPASPDPNNKNTLSEWRAGCLHGWVSIWMNTSIHALTWMDEVDVSTVVHGLSLKCYTTCCLVCCGHCPSRDLSSIRACADISMVP